jgi:hypothetical protein
MDRHFMMRNGYNNTGHSFNVFDGFWILCMSKNGQEICKLAGTLISQKLQFIVSNDFNFH